MSYLAKLKQSNQDSIRKLTEQVSKLNQSGENNNRDRDNYWKVTVDKAGNGSAIIRFLPPVENEDVPFVRYWDHGFQGPSGKWYIEKSRTSLGGNEKDPVSEYNSRLWKESDNDDSPQRKQVRKQKRREHYVSNILVIKDPGNPENNGKVFLYEYGKKIFNRLNELMHPIDDGIETKTPINPFDIFNGADFYLRARKVDGQRNYDTSSFGDAKAITSDESGLERILSSLHPLAPITDPATYKSYADLEKRLNEVLDLNTHLRRDDDEYVAPARQEAPAMKMAKPSYETAQAEDDVPWNTSTVTEDEDDDMAFFKKLAEED
jgi:hypothetical protein